MKTSLSILSCKLAYFVGSLLKRGTVWPGKIASMIDNDALSKVIYPNKVIIVTGSSGKGSTSSLLAHIYRKAGFKVIFNAGESNVRNAIFTTILKNTGIFSHKLKGDILLLEADERYLSKTLPKGIITDMIITNITRDQPTRNVHPDVIYDAIYSAIDDNVHLYINADDPIVNKVKLTHKGKITTYGIGKNIYSSRVMPDYAQDALYCPKCHSKIEYSLYHYGNFGMYECPKCKFGRGNVDYEVTNIDLDNGTILVNGAEYNLNLKIFFAVYYTLAAVCFSKENGISDNVLELALNKEMIGNYRQKEYDLLDRKVIMIDSKTENAPSFIQSLDFMMRSPGKKCMIMGFDSVSRRYGENDLSWLYDVPYEKLNNDEVDKVFCIGKFRYDVAARAYFAGIKEEKIIVIDDLNTLIDDVVSKSDGNIYTTFYYDLAGKVIELIDKKNGEYNEKK